MNYYKDTEYMLYNYKMMKISIENMRNEIEYLNQNDGMAGISYDGISTSPTNECKSATENIALSNMEKMHYLERMIQRATLKIESIDRALEGLDKTERAVIEEKYINNKQWRQVAYKVGYGERHCKRLRTEAIKKMALGIFRERLD